MSFLCHIKITKILIHSVISQGIGANSLTSAVTLASFFAVTLASSSAVTLASYLISILFISSVDEFCSKVPLISIGNDDGNDEGFPIGL